MFRTTDLLLVALALSQVLAAVVKPEVFSENAITEVLSDNERISSGWEAYPGQFPYMTALRVMNSGGTVDRCGGAVVARNWVLTSGRCVANRISIVVSAGVTDLTSEPEYISEDNEWWNHPSYDGNSATGADPNNIGILKLPQPLTYSKLVQPIRIQPSADANANYDSEVLVTCGWGRLWGTAASDYPDVLNWVYLRGMTNAACRQIFANANDANLCAGAYNVSSQSACFGDNGGPLVQAGRDGEPVLVGLTAFWSGAGCHIANQPTGFIRPGLFHGWLTDVTDGFDFENLNEEDEVTETPEPTTTVSIDPQTTVPTDPTTIVPTDLPTTESTNRPTIVPTDPPTTVPTVRPTTVPTDRPTIIPTVTPTTIPTVRPTTLPTDPPNPVPTSRPTTLPTDPSSTVPTDPPTTVPTDPPTTVPTNPPTSVAPEPASAENGENSNDSESMEDPEISQLPKKLHVKVLKVSKVNNNINIS